MSLALIASIGRFRAATHHGGNGFIAGTLPVGIVRVNSEPSAREVEVRHRETRKVVATVQSAADGTYRLDNLNTAETFDVIGRDWKHIYNDVIVSRVTPADGAAP